MALAAAAAARYGVQRRDVSDAEIVERLFYPMINEGAALLDEGIAIRPGDIDVIWTNGFGFPAYRGGPMMYADQVGVAAVRDRLAEYAKRLRRSLRALTAARAPGARGGDICGLVAIVHRQRQRHIWEVLHMNNLKVRS